MAAEGKRAESVGTTGEQRFEFDVRGWLLVPRSPAPRRSRTSGATSSASATIPNRYPRTNVTRSLARHRFFSTIRSSLGF